MLRRIAIIGAGPAGCVSAILLGRAGLDVTLIEQHRFPRDKVCGECVSATGAKVLRDLQVQGDFAQLTRALFFAHGGSSLKINLPQPMWGITRARLDSILLNVAAKVCRAEQPARCESIRAQDKTMRVAIRRTETNELIENSFDLILRAEGKSSDTGRSDDFGMKAHFRNIDAPADAIEIFGVGGHYGGIAPVGGGVSNFSFSVPATRINRCRGDFDALLTNIVQENRELFRQMRNAQRIGEWMAAPLKRYGVADTWPANQIPIGNAAAAIEPIGGEGMGLAMRSAQLAAEEIIAAHREGRAINTNELRRQFRALYSTRGMICRLAAKVVSRPAVASPLLEFLNCSPALTRAALHLIGK